MTGLKKAAGQENHGLGGQDIFTAPLFPAFSKAEFLARLNRFVVRCRLSGREVEAHLPNPGRLWELLLPGRTLYLVGRPADRAGLPYTVAAVERDGVPVLLHTQANNTVAASLIAAGEVPGLEDANIIKGEARLGRNRFDFLLEKDGRPFYLEVKSCTLAGRSIAMFPDAVTVRGKRHLEELAALRDWGVYGGVLFLVHWPYARYFLPDYHTDLAFAEAFSKVRDDIFLKALVLEWRKDLTLCRSLREAVIPWETIEREAKDCGSYLLVLHLPRAVQDVVGALGEIAFAPGYYLYVGTAKKGLTKRIARHLRRATPRRWHIDYLKAHADRLLAIPVRASDPLEHELAAAVDRIAAGCVASFGSSDCDCPGHLFYFSDDPLRQESFVRLLQGFRIDRLEASLNPQTAR